MEEIKEHMLRVIREALPQAIDSHKVHTEARLAGIEDGIKKTQVRNADMKGYETLQAEMNTRFEGLGKLLTDQALDSERIGKELEEIKE